MSFPCWLSVKKIAAVLGHVSLFFAFDLPLVHAQVGPESPGITEKETASMDDFAPPNWLAPTLGGVQFWTDYRWWNGWHLQKNAVTGHWRLLDGSNFRHAWGSREHCEKALDQKVAHSSEVPNPDRVIFLMHGLMRSSRSMDSLKKYLEGRKVGTVISPEYASTRASIAEHALAFRSLVESLPGKPRIDVVGHSMGNIVVRHAISDWQKTPPTEDVLARFGKMVMLGPPNQGAQFAKRLSKVGLFEMVTGRGGMELGPSWSELQRHLAVPPFPFAIVAGKLENPVVKNPLMDREGDWVVSVEETKLDGCASYVEVPVLHSFLMDDPRVHAFLFDFLESPGSPR